MGLWEWDIGIWVRAYLHKEKELKDTASRKVKSNMEVTHILEIEAAIHNLQAAQRVGGCHLPQADCLNVFLVSGTASRVFHCSLLLTFFFNYNFYRIFVYFSSCIAILLISMISLHPPLCLQPALHQTKLTRTTKKTMLHKNKGIASLRLFGWYVCLLTLLWAELLLGSSAVLECLFSLFNLYVLEEGKT